MLLGGCSSHDVAFGDGDVVIFFHFALFVDGFHIDHLGSLRSRSHCSIAMRGALYVGNMTPLSNDKMEIFHLILHEASLQLSIYI